VTQRDRHITTIEKHGRMGWLEFCGLVGTLIVDEEAVFDPRFAQRQIAVQLP